MTRFKSVLKALDITVGNTFFTIAFFTGIILTCFEIGLYRLTFINFSIPFFIWILSGLFITPFLFKILPRHLEIDSLFKQLVFNILTWGGIIVYLFMALNFYCADPTPKSLSLIINDKGTLAKGRSGCGERYVIIKHDNFEKQIVLPCGTSTDGFKAIDLTLRKGWFGFDIIESKTLVK